MPWRYPGASRCSNTCEDCCGHGRRTGSITWIRPLEGRLWRGTGRIDKTRLGLAGGNGPALGGDDGLLDHQTPLRHGGDQARRECFTRRNFPGCEEPFRRPPQPHDSR